MSRTAKAILIAVFILLGGSLAAAPTGLRRATRAQISNRCRGQLGATCTVGRIELAADGLFLENLRFRSLHGHVNVLVQKAAVPLSWRRLLFRQSQPLDVRVEGVSVATEGTLAQIREDLRPRRYNSEHATTRRFVLHRLDLQRIQMDLRAQLGTTSLAGTVLNGSLLWGTDGTSVQWSQARLATSAATNLNSGSCLALQSHTDGWVIDCGGFDVAAEVGEIAPLLASLRAAIPSAANSRPDSAFPTRESGGSHPVTLRAHDGRIRGSSGQNTVFDASPTSATLRVESNSLQDGEISIGRVQGDQPAIQLSYSKNAEAWRVALDAAELPLQQLAPWIPGVPWHDVQHGIVRANVRVTPSTDRSVVLIEGSTQIQGLGLHHRMLARDPVDGLSVELRGRALLDVNRRRVASEGLDVSLNGIPLNVAGWFERQGDHLALDGSLRLSDVGCDSIRRSLPTSVTGPLDGFMFGGTLGADLHVSVDSDQPQASSLDLAVRDGCQVLHDNLTATLSRFSGPFIQRVEEPGGVLRAFVTGPGSPAWVPLAMISPLVAGAVVTREDGSFYRHHGFSPEEIRGAFVRDVTARRFAYGASTITMQLVKNILLAREKTLVRKLQEVVLTWWIEQSLTKDAILELYLNVVEFGPGIYGIGPASRFFFGREPHELTPLQAIYLSTLLPAPIPRFANFERGTVGGETLLRLRRVARSMLANHRMTEEEFAAANSETLVFRPRRAPIPGAVTLEIDPNLTDQDAARLVESIRPSGVRISQTPEDQTTEAPSGDSPAAPEDPTDSRVIR